MGNQFLVKPIQFGVTSAASGKNKLAPSSGQLLYRLRHSTHLPKDELQSMLPKGKRFDNLVSVVPQE